MSKLLWKNEGNGVGPLYRVGADGRLSNYKDSKQLKFGGGFFPEWYMLGQAQRITKAEGATLEKV